MTSPERTIRCSSTLCVAQLNAVGEMEVCRDCHYDSTNQPDRAAQALPILF
jgi:hypothetical protein